jgi:hypothetical protein
VYIFVYGRICVYVFFIVFVFMCIFLFMGVFVFMCVFVFMWVFVHVYFNVLRGIILRQYFTQFPHKIYLEITFNSIFYVPQTTSLLNCWNGGCTEYIDRPMYNKRQTVCQVILKDLERDSERVICCKKLDWWKGFKELADFWINFIVQHRYLTWLCTAIFFYSCSKTHPRNRIFYNIIYQIISQQHNVLHET